MDSGTQNALYLSDFQAGDRLAMCPDFLGGSELQHKLWLNYKVCLDCFAATNKGEKFVIIFGAEWFQGDWFRFDAERLPKQFKILREILRQIKEHVADELISKSYLLTGNEVHNGVLNAWQEIASEFKFADEMKMVRDPIGNWSWGELKIKFPNDAILHATHFFNYTTIYPLTAYAREYKEFAVDYAETGERPPDFYYRAHVHRANAYYLQKHPRTTIGVFTTPGWQLKSEYVRKKLSRLKRTEYGLAMTTIENINGKDKIVLKQKTEVVESQKVEVA